jgi:hypothetical protein
MLKNSFSSLAAALETRAIPPVMPEATPRFVVIARNGEQFLTDENRRVIYRRRATGLPGERVTGDMRAPGAASERDLWHNGTSPRHSADSAWAVREEFRRWRIWHQ